MEIRNLNLSGVLKNALAGQDLEAAIAICGDDIRPDLYSFELGGEPDTLLRLFSQGNQITLKKNGVYHSGNGGTFCEYMFGLQMPHGDFLKEGILNRLVLFGTSSKGKALTFSEKTEGIDTYESIFNSGHLYCNYYFFVSFHGTSPLSLTMPELQSRILKSLGKHLKRSDWVRHYDDDSMAQLTRQLTNWLVFKEHSAQVRTTVFVVRLFNRPLYEFVNATFAALENNTEILLHEEEFFQRAGNVVADRFVSERLRLDLAYKVPRNRRIIDKYKALITKSFGNPSKMEEIHRLRTLCLRQNIPSEILTAIEQRLPQSNFDLYRTEPSYIHEARQILEERVMQYAKIAQKQPGKTALESQHLQTLLTAKYRAEKEGSRAFEQLLLDYSHRVDQSKDPTAAGLISQVITLVHSYEHLQRVLSRLVFVEGVRLEGKSLINLRNAYRLLSGVSKHDLNQIVIAPLVGNLYATHYGKEKLQVVLEALDHEVGTADVITTTEKRLAELAQDEETYAVLDRFIRENIKIFYVENNSEKEREALRQRISLQLQQEGRLKTIVPKKVFDLVLKHLQMESIYLNHILPETILNGDWRAREEFMRASQLDQTRIESIERSYCKRNHLEDNYIEILLEREMSKHKSAIQMES